MNNTPKFCEQCGAALAADSRFCETCGSAVATVAAGPPGNAPAPVPADPVAVSRPDRPIHWPAAMLTIMFMTLLAVGGVAFWLWAPSRSGPEPDGAAETAKPTDPAAPTETATAPPVAEEPLPLVSAEAPPDAPDAVDMPIEDWFASQPWFVELAESMPAGVTLMLFSRPDEELPGATTVEVRENRAPDSGFDPDISPLVGIFRVSQDRSRIFFLNVAEDEYVPLGRFLAARYQPDPVMQAPDAPVPAPLPPVEVVYRSFMDEAFRSRSGNLRAGSPHITDHRIDNTITVEGQTLAYVFVEIANDGRTAEVLVGPQDAGADRTYTLERKPDGWKITGIEEGEF